jgi:hypothetical protein
MEEMAKMVKLEGMAEIVRPTGRGVRGSIPERKQ